MTQDIASVPHGMRVVSEEEFFALLRADPRDIMPSIINPAFTAWETPRRETWGWSVPGWKNPGTEKMFAVRASP